jgi:hypothetical protein
MSRSLIRKNQLHPDIADLVGQYGSGFFQSPFQSVLLTGNQTIDDIKNFSSRPTFNGVGLATTGDTNITTISNLKNGQDVVTFLNNTYFPITQASISLNGYSLQQLGTTLNPIYFVGSITTGDATIRDLKYKISGNQVGNTVDNPLTTFNIGIGQPIGNTTQVSVEVSSIINAVSTTASASQSIQFEAPHYYGVGAINLSPSQITGTLTKGLSLKYNPTITFTTNDTYMYFAYPNTWGNLSSIKDANNFSQKENFIKTTINLPLINSTDYSYNIYKFNTPTFGTYIITFSF